MDEVRHAFAPRVSFDSLDEEDLDSDTDSSAASHLSSPDDFDVLGDVSSDEDVPHRRIPTLDAIPDNYYLALRQSSAHRPDALPPRGDDESLEIDQKVMQMNQTIQRRLIDDILKSKGKNSHLTRREARRRKKLVRAMKKQVAQSQSSESARETALAKYRIDREDFLRRSLLIWRDKILRGGSSNFERLKCSRMVLRMWRRGLPPAVRGRVWRLAVGNELGIDVDLFESLKRMELPTQEAEGVASVSVVEIQSSIALDLVRTHPHLQIFQEGGPYHESFLDVLYCWIKFRPQIGYVQGMSYLVAMLLLNMDAFSAFKMFANLILSEDYHFATMFSLSRARIDKYSKILGLLMQKKLPELATHFEQLGISHDVFILDWFITLFSRTFPLDIATHFWDTFFIPQEGGVMMLFRTTIGILLFFFPKLIQFNFDEIMYFLSHMKEQVHDDDRLELLKAISLVKISQRVWKRANLIVERSFKSNQGNS